MNTLVITNFPKTPHHSEGHQKTWLPCFSHVITSKFAWEYTPLKYLDAALVFLSVGKILS